MYKVKLLYVGILFILIINLSGIISQGVNDTVFELEVIGARWAAFGGPCPPNQSLTEPCTWDAGYYSELYFRLIYNGNVTCNITSLKVWQELNVKNVVYNHTGPINIPSPPYSLKKGYFYEFKVEGGFYSQYFGNITLEIKTLEIGTFIVSTWYNEHSVLSLITSWEARTPIEEVKFSTGILIISIILYVLKRKKRE